MFTLSSHAYIRNILQLHFIHLRVQLHSFRRIVHGASGLTYEYKQEPNYDTVVTTNNPFGGLFTDKSVQEIKRSLRAHRGALTKITCYIDTDVSNHHAHRKRVPRARTAQGKDGN